MSTSVLLEQESIHVTDSQGRKTSRMVDISTEWGQEEEVYGTKRHTKDTTSPGGGGVLRAERKLDLSRIRGSPASGLQQTAL